MNDWEISVSESLIDPLALPDESCTFLAQWTHQRQFELLFNQLNDVFFFAKDAMGRLLVMNEPLVRRFAQLLGRSTSEVFGLTDYELHPKELADQYRADDFTVMTTGQPLIGRIEMWYNDVQELDWSVTNKVPVFDHQSIVIGVMGTVRSYQMRRGSAGKFSLVDTVVEFIQSRHRQRISVSDIARNSRVSVRQLHRQFHDVFSMSVQEFLVRTRLQSAKTALLQSDAAVSRIAIDCGFYDQSSMTKLFRKYFKTTPLKFRQKYRPQTQWRLGE